MKADFLNKFRKNYRIRIKPFRSLDTRFEVRYRMFLDNSLHPLLRDHALTGSKKSLRAFSITGDIRVLYYVKDGIAYFVDIGTHNQVYK